MNYIQKQSSHLVSKTFADFNIRYLKEHNILEKIHSCLDIGSDVGMFVKQLNDMGIDAIGIEHQISKIRNAVTRKIMYDHFDLNYDAERRFDLITLLQSIYFLGDTYSILEKLKGMLNPNGVIFITTSPSYSTDHSWKYPEHKLYSREEYHIMAEKLELKVLDYTEVQSNISTSFSKGKPRAVLNMMLFNTKIKNPILKKQHGNFAHILLQRNK